MRRWEDFLIKRGFGVRGDLHKVRVRVPDRDGKERYKEGWSSLWLFPGKAKFIFNMDESPVASTDTHTGRSTLLCPVGLPATHAKSKKAQLHTTYVACMGACDYDRDPCKIDGRVVIPAVKGHNGTARPGQVRSR
jgi:hypothetical protein